MKNKILSSILVVLGLSLLATAGPIEPYTWRPELQTRTQLQVQQMTYEGLGSQVKNNFRISHGLFFGDQTFPLELENAQLYGYPYAQSVGLSFVIDSLGSAHHGLSYYFSRQGWDREDFLWLEPKEDWSVSNHSHMATYVVAFPQYELLMSTGWQGTRSVFREPQQRVVQEQDYWTFFTQYHFAEIGLVGQSELKQVFLGLDFQNKPEKNLKFKSWTQYTPSVQAHLNIEQEDVDWDNSFIVVNQKIWNKYAYTRVVLADSWKASWLDFYFDPTHFFSAHLNAFDHQGSLYYGGKVSLGPISMGYNDFDVYRDMAGLHSSFTLQIALNISALHNQLYLKPGASGGTEGVIDSKEKAP